MVLINRELIAIAEESKLRFVSSADPRLPGIRDWLVRGGTYFVASTTPTYFEVTATDASWADANGADFARYLWAARESLLPRSCPDYDARSIGWAAVSTYYTAFYLSLAVLRMFGYGMMYLSADDTSNLAAAPGAATKLDKGTYVLKISPGPRSKIELQQKRVRGFHDGFWQYADDCLKQVANQIGAGVEYAKPFSVQHRNAAILSVEALREWLGKPGSAGRDVGWMSELRNDINYRLARYVWAPNYREGGVSANRLRQDIVGIVRGTRDRLGVQLRLDRDVRAMVERVSVIFRDLSALQGFPAI